ncbi:class I SAM-dependent methyltransferase [Rhodobacteraceae bacterium KMM 6894]|nr:class I SAM-dependent methyltransferase [Rhodobacteraceae bacterium KMM 6894]
MSSDPETLKVYADKARHYADLTASQGEDRLLASFIAAMPAGGRVLDLGCGPGVAAHAMADAGLQTDAMDAVPEMVKMAARHPDVTARIATFDDISGVDHYDGIWSNFSLLHAPRADMPRHLRRIAQALKPDGRLHVAVKSGTGEQRDTLGRLYTYYTTEELCELLRDAGLTPGDITTGSGKGMDGTLSDWIAVTAHG